MTPLRVCVLCGIEFPLTEKHWHKQANGFRDRCKRCACEASRKWYHDNPEQAAINHRNSNRRRSAKRAEARRMREAAHVAQTRRSCNVCHRDFPLTADFWHWNKGSLSETCKECAKRRAREWYLANTKRAQAAMRANREEHPEKVIARRVRYKKQNPEKIRAANAALYQRNREKRIAQSAQWRRDNPEKASLSRHRDYENNKEGFKRRAKAWYRANRDRALTRAARQKALRRNAPGHFGVADIREQRRKQAGLCFYCHAELGQAETIDHVIPLSKGGTNHPENIVLACWPCNNRKRAMMPDQFVKSGTTGK